MLLKEQESIFGAKKTLELKSKLEALGIEQRKEGAVVIQVTEVEGKMEQISVIYVPCNRCRKKTPEEIAKFRQLAKEQDRQIPCGGY